jgi:uncharacterized protein involved in oxidation of intracellular sulfur
MMRFPVLYPRAPLQATIDFRKCKRLDYLAFYPLLCGRGPYHIIERFHFSLKGGDALCGRKSFCLKNYKGKIQMKILFVITTDDGETIYNAMRLANVGVKKGDEVSVFMLGKGVLFEQAGNEQFNVMEQINQFEGDFYV